MEAKISVTEQLAIIRLAKADLIKNTKLRKYMGLCYHLDEAIFKGEFSRKDCLKEYIPLFTRENAIKYFDARIDCIYAFWWTRDDEGASKRIAFLDWMEKELLS